MIHERTESPLTNFWLSFDAMSCACALRDPRVSVGATLGATHYLMAIVRKSAK